MLSRRARRAIGAGFVAFVGLVGCAGAADSGEGEGEGKAESVGVVAAAATTPPEGPVGPPCTDACQRFDTTGAIANTCCLCNGYVGVFRQSPTLYRYWCMRP